MVPAVLLQIDAEITHRQATVKQDWARSRRAPRTPVRTRPLSGLGRRAARLLHA
jgi:hypothetical protein